VNVEGKTLKLDQVRDLFQEKFSSSGCSLPHKDNSVIYVNAHLPHECFELEEHDNIATLEEKSVLTILPQKKLQGGKRSSGLISPYLNLIDKSFGSLIDDSMQWLEDDQRMTVSKFLSSLSRFQCDNLVHLHIHGNLLSDESLRIIANKIPKKLPNLELINLSTNRFKTKSSPYIDTLLKKCPKLKWIIIIGNTDGLSTIANVDWFGRLSEVSLLKIIFVSEKWVHGDTWVKILGKNQKHASAVRESHVKYFELSTEYWDELQREGPASGFRGATGPAWGVQGPTGPTGPVWGVQGATGPAWGVQGATGPAWGVQGATGPA